jgi:hypothetical protein
MTSGADDVQIPVWGRTPEAQRAVVAHATLDATDAQDLPKDRHLVILSGRVQLGRRRRGQEKTAVATWVVERVTGTTLPKGTRTFHRDGDQLNLTRANLTTQLEFGQDRCQQGTNPGSRGYVRVHEQEEARGSFHGLVPTTNPDGTTTFTAYQQRRGKRREIGRASNLKEALQLLADDRLRKVEGKD